MAKDDEGKKTAFHHKSRCLLLYKDAFCLKNAGAIQATGDNSFRGTKWWPRPGVLCFEQIPIQVSRNVSPLFKTLKKCAKKGDFRWTTEAEEAFTQLKQHIAALPTLVAPRPGEELIMYLSATHGAISAVLINR
ncbi:reverse transcriptase domain-containing protein [Tanacetum coccineum]